MAVKKITILLILFLFGVISAYSQADNSADYSSQILTFEKKFKTINQSLDYLQKKNMEISDLNKAAEDAETLFKQIKDDPDSLKDYDMALQLLGAKVSSLEEKISGKISFAGRSAFMYIAIVAAGIGIITFMVIYLIIMYFRRK
jgi:uncharacterized protein YoxC